MLTLHVGGALARAGWRVLAIELDPGSTLTAGLGVPNGFAGPTVADVILGGPVGGR